MNGLKSKSTKGINGSRGQEWTVIRNESERSFNSKLDVYKRSKLTIQSDQSERSSGMKVYSPEKRKSTVVGCDYVNYSKKLGLIKGDVEIRDMVKLGLGSNTG